MDEMSGAQDIIRKLLQAHFEGDEESVRALAWEVVERERRLNHHTLASDIERLLTEANGAATPRQEILSVLKQTNGNLPRDKERNAPLIELSQPKRTMDDLVLAPDLRASLDRIVQERRKSDVLRSHGVRPVGKLLFCGPPGCGKSAVAEALANDLFLPLATVRFDAVVSSYLGETAANLRKVFDFARSRPVVLLFDEFDAIGKHRTAADEHGELKRVVNSFLQLLDSFHAETLTIAATNHQGLLDSALWRRFDDILFFRLPTQGEIEVLLCRHFGQMSISRLVRLGAVARSLVSFAHADVERVTQDAIKQTLLLDRTEVEAEILHAAVDREAARRAITEELDAPAAPRQGPQDNPTRRGPRKHR
jgi:SpoVK/Ycf46/Vps4 family AAA+-type ATPase